MPQRKEKKELVKTIKKREKKGHFFMAQWAKNIVNLLTIRGLHSKMNAEWLKGFAFEVSVYG